MSLRGHILGWVGALLALALPPAVASADLVSLGTARPDGALPELSPLRNAEGVVTSWAAGGNYKTGTLRHNGSSTDVRLVAPPPMEVAAFSQNVAPSGAGVLIWQGTASNAMHFRSPYLGTPSLLTPYYGIFIRRRSSQGGLGPAIKVAETFDPENGGPSPGPGSPIAVRASAGRWLVLWRMDGTIRMRLVMPDNSLGNISELPAGIVVPHRRTGQVSVLSTRRTAGRRCSITITTVRARADLETTATSRLLPRCPTTELAATETSNGNLTLAWADHLRILRPPCGEVALRADVVVARASASRQTIGRPRAIGRSAEIHSRLVERPAIAVAGFNDGRSTVAWIGPRVLTRTIGKSGALGPTVTLSPPNRIPSGVVAVGSARGGLVSWIETGLDTARCRSTPSFQVVARAIKPSARGGTRYAFPGTVLTGPVPVVRPNGTPLAVTWVGRRNSIALLSRP